MTTIERLPVPPSIEDIARRPTWTADRDYINCTHCSLAFELTRRRHHCRRCGNLFCDACSIARVPLPALGYVEPVRVCAACAGIALREAERRRELGNAGGINAYHTRLTDAADALALLPEEADGVDGRALEGVNVFISSGDAPRAAELCRALLGAGADVYVAFADVKLGRRAAGALVDPQSEAFERLHLLECNPASLNSVRRCANTVLDLNMPLDLLVLNAQTLGSGEYMETKDGNEYVYQYNFLSSFLLALLLEPALCAAPAARVVHVSSEVHSFAKASVEDLGGHRYYSAPIIGRWKQFGAVSGMTILFAGMLDWRYRQLGVNCTSNAVSSGAAALAGAPLSPLQRSLGAWLAGAPAAVPLDVALLHALLAPHLPAGRLYARARPAWPAPYALDPALGAALWRAAARAARLAGPHARPPAVAAAKLLQVDDLRERNERTERTERSAVDEFFETPRKSDGYRVSAARAVAGVGKENASQAQQRRSPAMTTVELDD